MGSPCGGEAATERTLVGGGKDMFKPLAADGAGGLECSTDSPKYEGLETSLDCLGV